MVLSCDGCRLCSSWEDAKGGHLRRAVGWMLAETNVTTLLVLMLLLGRRLKMVWAAIAAMVTVAAAVVFSLAGSLLAFGAAGPLAGHDETGWDEEGASFGAGE